MRLVGQVSDAANITYNALRVSAGGGITVGRNLLGVAKQYIS